MNHRVGARSLYWRRSLDLSNNLWRRYAIASLGVLSTSFIAACGKFRLMGGKLCLLSTNKSSLISVFLESAHLCPTWGMIAAGKANAVLRRLKRQSGRDAPGETSGGFRPLRFGGLMTILQIRGLLWRIIPTLGALVVRNRIHDLFDSSKQGSSGHQFGSN